LLWPRNGRKGAGSVFAGQALYQEAEAASQRVAVVCGDLAGEPLGAGGVTGEQGIERFDDLGERDAPLGVREAVGDRALWCGDVGLVF